jgi:hypothetical protein
MEHKNVQRLIERSSSQQKHHDDDHHYRAEASAVVMIRRAHIEATPTEQKNQNNQ